MLPFVGGILLAGSLWVSLSSYTVRGSAHTGPAVKEILGACAEDEGEAVASGASSTGARARCIDAARNRLIIGAALVAIGVVAVGSGVAMSERRNETMGRQKLE